MTPAQVRTSANTSARSSSSSGGQYAIGRGSQRLHGKAELTPEDPRFRADARGPSIHLEARPVVGLVAAIWQPGREDAVPGPLDLVGRSGELPDRVRAAGNVLRIDPPVGPKVRRN